MLSIGRNRPSDGLSLATQTVAGLSDKRNSVPCVDEA